MNTERVDERLAYTLSLRLGRNHYYFGPGPARLLELSEQTGSLHAAAKTMGMAYSKAWKIVRYAEESIGFPLLVRQTGGVHGGGSTLTPEGKDFLERYTAFEQAMYQTADSLFLSFFPEFK